MRATFWIRVWTIFLLALFASLALQAAAQGGGGGGGGGGAGHAGPGGSEPPILFLVLFAGVFVLAIGHALWSSRRRLVYVLLLLEDGYSAVPALDDVLRSARFDSEAGRQAVSRQLRDLCAGGLVLESRVFADSGASNYYLYFFYGPNPGKRLTREEGMRLHALLCSAACLPSPAPSIISQSGGDRCTM